MKFLSLSACLLFGACVPAMAQAPAAAPPETFPVTIQAQDFTAIAQYLAAEPYAKVAQVMSILLKSYEASKPKPAAAAPDPHAK